MRSASGFVDRKHSDVYACDEVGSLRLRHRAVLGHRAPLRTQALVAAPTGSTASDGTFASSLSSVARAGNQISTPTIAMNRTMAAKTDARCMPPTKLSCAAEMIRVRKG